MFVVVILSEYFEAGLGGSAGEGEGAKVGGCRSYPGFAGVLPGQMLGFKFGGVGGSGGLASGVGERGGLPSEGDLHSSGLGEDGSMSV
ncbi:hypothetical protein OJ252_2265 [Cryptosporidium canis]|uniref:Uncharacterized protein n=1 Tax=Cryptosporidium canis TaxID=195482 RepID=A0ABQ8P5N5_9CRYT|nr:hypothetical protein OJ252_2265 [Cryptosporidium canis]